MAALVPGITPTVGAGRKEKARASCSCPFVSEKQKQGRLGSEQFILLVFIVKAGKGAGVEVNLGLLFLGEWSWVLNQLSLFAFIFYFHMKCNAPKFGSGVGQLKRIVSWKWGKHYLQGCPKEISARHFDIHDGSAWLRSVIRCQLQGQGPHCQVSRLLACVWGQTSLTFVKTDTAFELQWFPLMPEYLVATVSPEDAHPSHCLGKDQC